MNDLISRQELINRCDDVIENGIPNELGLHPIVVEVVKFIVETMPSVDAEEVIHAEWQLNNLNGFKVYDCSNCGIHMECTWDYCPNCGARMDGDEM